MSSESPRTIFPERNYSLPKHRLRYRQTTLRPFTYGKKDVPQEPTVTDVSEVNTVEPVSVASTSGHKFHQQNVSTISRKMPKRKLKSKGSPRSIHSRASESITSATCNLPTPKLKKQQTGKRNFHISMNLDEESPSSNEKTDIATNRTVKRRKPRNVQRSKVAAPGMPKAVKIWKGSNIKRINDILDIDVIFAALLEIHGDIRAEVNTSEEEDIIDHFFNKVLTELKKTLTKAHELQVAHKKRKSLLTEMKRASEELLQLSEQNIKHLPQSLHKGTPAAAKN